jgi:hypothetical protein
MGPDTSTWLSWGCCSSMLVRSPAAKDRYGVAYFEEKTRPVVFLVSSAIFYVGSLPSRGCNPDSWRDVAFHHQPVYNCGSSD